MPHASATRNPRLVLLPLWIGWLQSTSGGCQLQSHPEYHRVLQSVFLHRLIIDFSSSENVPRGTIGFEFHVHNDCERWALEEWGINRPGAPFNSVPSFPVVPFPPAQKVLKLLSKFDCPLTTATALESPPLTPFRTVGVCATLRKKPVCYLRY